MGRDTDRVLRFAFDALPDSAAILDSVGRIIGYNATWRRFAIANACSPGYSFDGKSYIKVCLDVKGPDAEHAGEVAEGIRAVLNRKRIDFTLEYPCNSPFEKRWYMFQAFRLAETGGALILHRNITEQRRVSERFRHNYRSYAAAFHASKATLWEWDPLTDAVQIRRRADADPGAASSLTTKLWLDTVHPKDRARLAEAMLACADGATVRLRVEHRQRDDRGRWRWIVTQGVALTEGGRSSRRVVGSQADITRRRRREDALEEAALHDGLTGLPNRTLFLRRLDQALSDDQDSAVGLLFLDLDDFKRINDVYGHVVGDRVLNQVAQRLSIAVRSQDILARMGGDEFAVLLEDIHRRSEVVATAQRLCKALERPLDIDGREVQLGVSVGGWVQTGGDEDPEEIIAHADEAMYQVKRSGKNNYLVPPARDGRPSASLAEHPAPPSLKRASTRRGSVD